MTVKNQMSGHKKTIKSKTVDVLQVPTPKEEMSDVDTQSINEVLSKPDNTNAELQQSINEAVAKAGELPQKSKKQLDKEAEQEKRYWNGMISREECRTMVLSAIEQSDERLRMLFITTSTLMNFVLERGLATKEELDVISRPIVQQMYGMSDEQYEAKMSEQKERSEKAKQDKEEWEAKLKDDLAQGVTVLDEDVKVDTKEIAD